MNILRLAGEILLIYILYKLIFDFIIPIYQTSKRVKKQFSEMQNRMQQEMNAKRSQPSQPERKEPAKNEEYIDYEEIKG